MARVSVVNTSHLVSARMKSPIPIMEGILPFDRPRFPTEVLAGVTLAALAIPEVMGYATIAGMPVVTGLYTLVLPMLVFAFFGSSRHLVVGADSATAAVMAASLAGMAATGSAEYVALAGLLALMAGAMMLIARLIKLGFIADFLSRTVLIGFLTGVGIQVAVGQLAGLIGVPTPKGGTLTKLVDTIKEIPDTSMTTLAVSLGVIGTILGLKVVTKKVPGALIAVLGALAVSYFADLSEHGVSVLGTVPGGLPSLSLPEGMTWADVGALVPTALSIFVLILAQSAATSRAYAAKYNESFNENTDLVGLGFANGAAAITGTFVVNGSPTKTQMVDSAGGRSQLAQITTGAITVIVLLFLTKPLQYLPNAVLAAVVFLIGIELVNISGMKRIARLRPDEFVVALLTTLAVVFIGVEQGIVLAIIASIIDHLRRSYLPNNTVLEIAGDRITSKPVAPELRTLPGLVVYRFNASLYYANAIRLFDEVSALMAATDPDRVRWLCIDAVGVSDIDYSAAETLKQIKDEAAEHDVRLVFAELQPDVRTELERFELVALFGEDAFYETVGDVIDAFRREGAPN
jgi:sulfate permease, SulP family